MTTLTKRAATGLALVIALALAACGGSGSGADGMSRPLPDEERTSVAADLSKLNASLLQVGSSSRDPRSMFDLDSSFHHRYVETARGPRLLALLDAIKPQAERYIRLYTSALVDEIGTSVKEHEDIVEAIGRGDGEAARSAVATNWINASHRLSRVIDTVGERGSW